MQPGLPFLAILSFTGLCLLKEKIVRHFGMLYFLPKRAKKNNRLTDPCEAVASLAKETTTSRSRLAFAMSEIATCL